MHDPDNFLGPDNFLVQVLDWLPLAAVVVLILILCDMWSIG